MDLSIIIPTLNRCDALKKTLLSIRRQIVTGYQFEVIVVDNGSTDLTTRLCQEFSALLPNLNYQIDAMPGLLTGRHRGASLARGNILSFIDDDVELIPTWVQGVCDSFKTHATTHLLTGSNLPKFEIEPPSWLNEFWSRTPYGGRCCTWLSLLELGDEEFEIDPLYVWGLNFSIRRDTLYHLGGFHPDNIPSHLQHFQGDGETGLSLKAKHSNFRALYTPKATLYHQVPAHRLTKEYFNRRAFYQGVCDSYTNLREEAKIPQQNEAVEVGDRSLTMSIWRRAYRRLHRELSSFLLIISQNKSTSFRKQLEIKHSEGYAFHQRAFREQDAVRNWVLKENYWEYKLPAYD